ncbi:MAG TPA: hypothetical protein VHE14_04485, partial [Solirubrobacteraceae bacterium]|nr:hypothetical protein [Solirubrobacteraceae bacterium]
AASEATQAMMDHLLNAEVMFPPLPAVLKPGAWIANQVLRTATIATMPRWQRRLANLRQPRLIDAAIVPPMRAVFRIAATSVRLQLRLLAMISPATVPVVEPMFRGIKPEREETVAPAEAFRRHGVSPPAELSAQLQNGAHHTAVGDGPISAPA